MNKTTAYEMIEEVHQYREVTITKIGSYFYIRNETKKFKTLRAAKTAIKKELEG